MGTWGPGILDSDLALDLKEQWNELLGEGYSPEDVSSHILAESHEEGMLDDIEEQYDLIVPFALIQWKSGRLQDDVKHLALELLSEENISNIEDTRWDDPDDLKKRKVNLLKVKTTLQSEQPKPNKIKKAYHASTKLKQGDLITIKLDSGHYVLLEVIEIITDYKSQYPVCVLFNYKSLEKPSKQIVDKLKVLKFDSGERSTPQLQNGSITFLSLSKRHSEPSQRIEMLEESRPPKDYQIKIKRLCEWKSIDEALEQWLTN